jgi:hypothetical protein
MGKIRYLDFSNDWMEEYNKILEAFLIKRKSFVYRCGMDDIEP